MGGGYMTAARLLDSITFQDKPPVIYGGAGDNLNFSECIFIVDQCIQTHPCQHFITIKSNELCFKDLLGGDIIARFLKKHELEIPSHFLDIDEKTN